MKIPILNTPEKLLLGRVSRRQPDWLMDYEYTISLFLLP